MEDAAAALRGARRVVVISGPGCSRGEYPEVSWLMLARAGALGQLVKLALTRLAAGWRWFPTSAWEFYFEQVHAPIRDAKPR